MKVVILYRPDSEHARNVETFVHDFKQRHPTTKVEVLNADSRDGVALGILYGMQRHPGILALAVDGTMLHMWEGEPLPLMDEVASYVYSPA